MALACRGRLSHGPCPFQDVAGVALFGGAAPADAAQLDDVVVDAKAGLAGGRLDELVTAAVEELGGAAAARADDGVGVPASGDDERLAVVEPVHALHRSGLGEDLERAIDGGQADTRCRRPQRVVEVLRGEGALSIDDGLDHQLALPRETKAPARAAR